MVGHLPDRFLCLLPVSDVTHKIQSGWFPFPTYRDSIQFHPLDVTVSMNNPKRIEVGDLFALHSSNVPVDNHAPVIRVNELNK